MPPECDRPPAAPAAGPSRLKRFARFVRRWKGPIAYGGLILALLGWTAWPHLSAGAAGLLAEWRGHYVEWAHHIPKEQRRWSPLPTDAAIWKTPIAVFVNGGDGLEALSPEDAEPLADALDRVERMWHVEYLGVTHSRIGLRDARRFAAIDRGERLACWNCDFAPGALAALAERGGYRFIELPECSFPPGELAGFATQFADRREVLFLRLDDSEGVGGQFAPFAGHPGLRQLYVRDTSFHDADLAAVASCENLQELELSDTAVTDAGLRALWKRPGPVDSLQLSGTVVTDAGFADLPEQAHLEGLSLANTAVTDATVRQLAERCPNLVRLDLSGTQVTDAALPHLARLTALQWLDLTKTRVTEKAIDPNVSWSDLREIRVDQAIAPPDAALRGWDPLGEDGPRAVYVSAER